MYPNLRIIRIKIKFKMQKSPPKEDPPLEEKFKITI